MKIQLFIIISFLTISCSSEKEFDLSKIRMPCNADYILNENYNFKKSSSWLEGYVRFNSKNKKLLVFDDINFKKEFSKEYFSPTSLEVYLDSINNQIPFIRLETSVKEDGKELYSVILKELGKPEYYNKDEKEFNALWKIDNTFFVLKQSNTLKIGGMSTIKSYLILLDKNNDKLVDYYLSIQFENYKDYLKAKSNLTDSISFSYLDFAKKQKPDYSEKNKYLEEINNNLPL